MFRHFAASDRFLNEAIAYGLTLCCVKFFPECGNRVLSVTRHFWLFRIVAVVLLVVAMTAYVLIEYSGRFGKER